uniref:Uncharacterized protein n=1 Tax=Kalanchoe fedtschenkoi TaxID=63787 RepID=A0A7N0ZSF2_KALFE
MDGAVLTYVINKLGDLLDQKVGLIAGAENEIRSLRDELSLLTIFLGVINDQNDGTTTPLAKELTQQLRRVSWKAEDVVDQYMLDVARHERKQFVKKVFTGCGMLSRKGELAEQAQDIKKKIEDILRNKEKYGVRLDSGTPSDSTARRNVQHKFDRRRNVEEEDVVGFDQQFHEVMEMLVPKGGVEDEGLRVVSIIGMGGLGKSTLARKVFNHREIKTQFGTRVWVVVSEHVGAKPVLKNILQCLKVNIEKDDDEYLKGRLKEQLEGSKYLIVLDDLWTPKQWEELKSYLPADRKRGSRILLTSRIENVAYAASTNSTTYHLKPLSDADSWSLFCKKALKSKECPPNLVDVGKGIVSKCKGLPLAIIVLGGLLSAAEAEPSTRYWSKILNDTSWYPDADNDCSKILSLSYHNLTPPLRMCFLYVGVFPEDFEIQANELCLLWVAEGFIKPQQCTELEEDLAEKYLVNLADRNLIMISKRKSDGRIKSCRIHDLLRDLCIKEAESCYMYKIHAVGAYQNAEEGIRRLTIHMSDSIALLSPPQYKGLRTLLDFTYNNSSNSMSACEHLSAMRVLRLSVDRFQDNSTKNLILLRYLKVHQFGFSKLSDVIMIRNLSKLSNLQILNLKSNPSVLSSAAFVTTNLPKEIWKLKLLRHVNVRPFATMPDAPSSRDSLPYLQTLSFIVYERHTSKMLSSGRFPNLRKVSVHLHPDESLRAVSLQSLPELVHLLALKITFYQKPLDLFSKPVPLSLNIVALPSALTKIHLKNTVLTSAHWRLLGELKNLQVLKLSTRGTYTTTSEDELFEKQPLVFETQAFSQLLQFKLRTRHRTLILEDGALRALQYLTLHRQNNSDQGVLVLLDQLWLSTSLRQVKVISPSKGMLDYIQSLDDSKRSKVTICADTYNYLFKL